MSIDGHTQNLLRSRLRQDRSLTRIAQALLSCPPTTSQIAPIVCQEHPQLYVVGGTLRNFFIDNSPSDLDLATSLAPQEIIDRLSAANMHSIFTSEKHLTVTAVIPHSFAYIEQESGEKENQTPDDQHSYQHVEITTLRDIPVLGNPELRPGSDILKDLEYRDFTVNALAYDFHTDELIDPYNGLADIANRVLRGVSSPHLRFKEDPLRIMRMVRLAVQYGLRIDTETWEAATALPESLITISPERLRDELTKLLLSPSPARGIELLAQCGALKFILPEVDAFQNFEQNKYHKADLFYHTLEALSNTNQHIQHSSEDNLILRLAALLHDVGKPASLSVDSQGERHFYLHEVIGAEMIQPILSRLRFSNDIIRTVKNLVRHHMRPIDCGHPGIRRLLRDTNDTFTLWRALKEADGTACTTDKAIVLQQLEHFDQQVELVKSAPDVSPLKSLAINGTDLLELGIPKGKQIGELLRKLHELVLEDPDCNTKEFLLMQAKELRN